MYLYVTTIFFFSGLAQKCLLAKVWPFRDLHRRPLSTYGTTERAQLPATVRSHLRCGDTAIKSKYIHRYISTLIFLVLTLFIIFLRWLKSTPKRAKSAPSFNSLCSSCWREANRKVRNNVVAQGGSPRLLFRRS